MPSKNKKEQTVTHYFIPVRSDQGRTSTRDSFTWPDKFYVVPRLCSDLSKEVDYK